MRNTMANQKRKVSEIVEDLEQLRLEFINTTDSDAYDTTIYACHMYLEGIASLEVAIHKLHQAELFRGREYAGNF